MNFCACVDDSYVYCLRRTEEVSCHVRSDVHVFSCFVGFWNIATLYIHLTCSRGMLCYRFHTFACFTSSS